MSRRCIKEQSQRNAAEKGGVTGRQGNMGTNGEVLFKVKEGFSNNHPECCSVCLFGVFH